MKKRTQQGSEVSEHERAQRRRALRMLPERQAKLRAEYLQKVERIIDSAIGTEFYKVIDRFYERVKVTIPS